MTKKGALRIMPRKARSFPEVPLQQLRWTLDPKSLPFKTTEELEPLSEIIGQDRALEAFRFGLGVRKKGYHVFVSGPTGTGRMSTALKILDEMARKDIIPDDLCYVYNFKDPEKPRLLRLEAGLGRHFKEDIQHLVDTLKKDVPLLFESEDYINMKREILATYDDKGKNFFKELDNRVKKEGFAIVQVQVGEVTRPVVMPIVNDQPTPMERLEMLLDRGEYPKEKFEAIKVMHRQLTEQVDRIFLEIRDMQREVQKKIEDIDRLIFLKSVSAPIDGLKKKYDQAKIHAFLDEMVEDMADNLAVFRAGPPQHQPAGPPWGMQGNPFQPYQVNVLVDNGETQGQPIVVENNPNYKNLFGTIDRAVDRSGMWTTDFSRIHVGSLLKANGGFLVLNLRDAIMEPGVWQGLKRALMTDRMEIETFDPFYLFTTTGMKPEPIELDIKVIVVAEPRLYYLLQYHEEDFSKIFKVRADFSGTMKKDETSIMQVARYIGSKCATEKLRPFDRNAVAALVEEAVRMSGRQEKISIQLLRFDEILQEVNFRAEQDGKAVVTSAHVEQTLKARVYRANLIEEQIQEMIDRGSILIDTEGAVVGQVNGLAVYMMGDYSFGKPSRITAATSMGRAGVVNIEREAELSGSTHNKGVLILSGYLRRQYAQKKPLTMTASIAFEQSYSGVDGDSASSTEIYAILSSLSGLPLRQDLAVTGSVNQKGEVQAIGGVNQKIEGFYDCCKVKGLSGTQGVLIPESNVKDLMLRKDVVETIAKGKFHVYPVKTINQGIEILTGIPAGEPDAQGNYPQGSVHHLIHEKLGELALGLKKFGEDEDKESAETPKGKKKK
jgi:lon-related putative ATP-dependent protease